MDITLVILGLLGILLTILAVFWARAFLRLEKIEAGPSWLKIEARFIDTTKPKHNLPQPTYGKFVGREKEISQIKKILRPYPDSQHSIISIDGIGGVGKSTLALEVGHWYLRNNPKLSKRERFDAIVWVSAKESILTADGILPRYEKTSTLADIMRAVIRTLSGETRLEYADPIAGLQAQTFALLSTNRTLLIVDNFESVDDPNVMSFIFEIPAPTKVIVTTRHRIDVAYPIRLVGMEWDDARDLISQECDRRGVSLTIEETRLLYKATGGIPLAIVWSVALLSFGHDLRSVIQKLSATTSDIARFCFGQIVESLQDTPAYNLLSVLSVLTEASRERLGYIARLPVIQRDEGLVRLEKLSLVNRTSQGKFSVAPLVAEYMLQMLESSEIQRLKNMAAVVPFFEVAPSDEEIFQRRATSGISIPIGKTPNGKVFNFVLGAYTDVHALILGGSGAGKTEMLKTLILNGLLYYRNREVEFAIIDHKGGKRRFPDVPGVEEFIWSMDFSSLIQEFVDFLQEEREKRQLLIHKYSAADFSEVNELAGEKLLPRLVVIMDDVAWLISESEQLRQLLHISLRIGRSLGIHYVLVSQSISGAVADLFPLIGARYVLRSPLSASELRRVIGYEGAPPTHTGEAIYLGSGESGVTSFRVAYLFDADLSPYLDILRKKQ